MKSRKTNSMLMCLLSGLLALTSCSKRSNEVEHTADMTGMSLLEIAKTRRAIRNFLPQEVEQKKLDYVLECLRLAPSAGNKQPWHFYIVKSREAKKAIYQSYTYGNIKGDPMFIVACGDSTVSWKRKDYDGKNYLDVDVAIAVEHLVLAATEQGLGTCWLAHFNPERLVEVLNIPENLTPIAIIPIGYPSPEQGRKSDRKPLNEIMETI